MTAVSDTSPICYLILIGEIDVLPKLFTQLSVPGSVLAELLHDDAPELVRRWAADLPTWLKVEDDPTIANTGMEKLQRGEQAAILLAESTKADMIVLDEKSARHVASDRGLRVTGTLGLLGEAATRGLVDLAPAIERLTKTSFRYSPALLKATLDRFGNR
jgi:predicted nucleic acid-binding protein